MLNFQVIGKKTYFKKIWEVGFINLAFFNRFHVKVPRVSSANTIDYKQGFSLTPPHFDGSEKAQTK